MDEVLEFCRRVLGADGPAVEAAEAVRAAGGAGRVELLAAAARICRRFGQGGAPAGIRSRPPVPDSLSAAVAAELAAATAKLPERHREALALRELLRLSHDQIAQVMEIDAAAVAPLLARARLRLRQERRGVSAQGGCDDADRALRVLARRQDSEPLSAEDDHWLHGHLLACATCNATHAAMIESSVCYRAWDSVPPAPSAVLRTGERDRIPAGGSVAAAHG
jgi:hypothetical protein